MNIKKLLTSILLSTLTLAPVASFAQDDTETPDNFLMTTIDQIALSISYGIAFGLMVGGAVGAGVSTTAGAPILLTALNKNERSILKGYIEDHQHQLAQDIALGGGETIDDLAHMYGVPTAKRAEFAKALRRERRTLFISQDPSIDEIERFGLIVLKLKYELDGYEVAIHNERQHNERLHDRRRP